MPRYAFERAHTVNERANTFTKGQSETANGTVDETFQVSRRA